MADSTGPAAAWTKAVTRSELATKALGGAIKLWDESGSAPTLERLAWSAVESARACLVQAQADEKRAFKRLEEAQSQTAIAFEGDTAASGGTISGPGYELGVDPPEPEDALAQAPAMTEER